jgi:hypothetical protein
VVRLHLHGRHIKDKLAAREYALETVPAREVAQALGLIEVRDARRDSFDLDAPLPPRFPLDGYQGRCR